MRPGVSPGRCRRIRCFLPGRLLRGRLLRFRRRRRRFRGRTSSSGATSSSGMNSSSGATSSSGRDSMPPDSSGATDSSPAEGTDSGLGSGACGSFGAVFEAVDRCLLLEFFERRARFLGRFFLGDEVFFLGGFFEVALDHRQFFGRAHEFGVAVLFARLAEPLDALDHAGVEVGDLARLDRRFGGRFFGRPDRRVHLGADRVALADEARLWRASAPPSSSSPSWSSCSSCRHRRSPRPRGRRQAAPEARRTKCRNRMRDIDASNGFGLLRPRDSNPDYLVPERDVLPLHQGATRSRQDN